ncbi:MAG TPA: polymer-forming cytoskeletal protein [Solirubrobacterales bacterium]|nr:polymer-forming cytoskeletal protein [Solirubrobacterales bacterium]
MRRISSLALFLSLAALALPAASPAQTSDHAEDAIVVVSGDVTVARGQTVDGVFVVSGDVRIAGHVDGDVVLVSGDVTVNGRIDGDLITIGGQARLLPRAFVDGDVRYGDERPIVAGDAIVRGDVTKKNGLDSLDLFPFLGAVVFLIGTFVSTAVFGALLLLIAPRAADAIEARSHERIGPLIAIGIAIAIALPVAAVVAGVTIVGLPLAFVILLALLPLGAVAYCASAWVLGRRMVKAPRNRFLAFLAGLAVLEAVSFVPIVGWIVGLAAVVFGLGLVGAAIGAAREGPPGWRQTQGS